MSFSVNVRGQQLIDAVFGERGRGQRYLPDYLRDWVLDEPVKFTDSLSGKLNPTADAGDGARMVMREALAFPGAGAERRRDRNDERHGEPERVRTCDDEHGHDAGHDEIEIGAGHEPGDERQETRADRDNRQEERSAIRQRLCP